MCAWHLRTNLTAKWAYRTGTATERVNAIERVRVVRSVDVTYQFTTSGRHSVALRHRLMLVP